MFCNKQKAIERFCELRKDVEQIIEDNKDTFNKFGTIEQIKIYGFSFSDIDTPYLYEIISHINVNETKWEISFFSNTDKENIDRFIKEARLPEKMITKIRLTDIQIDPQLKLFD